MLTPRLDRIYAALETIIADDRFGHPFANKRGRTAADLPPQYAAFVAADSRYLPGNWELYSYFGHDPAGLDDVRSRLRERGLADRWLVFGKTGDEDYLVFDTAAERHGAVLWCDADDLGAIESLPPFAASFAEMIAKVARVKAQAKLELARVVLADVDP
jgi:hypothetical protein